MFSICFDIFQERIYAWVLMIANFIATQKYKIQKKVEGTRKNIIYLFNGKSKRKFIIEWQKKLRVYFQMISLIFS